jgi:hypothetical protein
MFCGKIEPPKGSLIGWEVVSIMSPAEWEELTDEYKQRVFSCFGVPE